MSTWRKKAIECLPGKKKELAEPGATIYTVMMEMLGALKEAHAVNDREQLKKIYAFAEWCFHQKEKDLWNAAGVCFYEHLGDEAITRQVIPDWISKEIYDEIRGLLELRMSQDNLKELDERYRSKK